MSDKTSRSRRRFAVQPSKKELTQEIIRSGKDCIYFLNNFAAISHPKKGRIAFKTFQYQDDLLRAFINLRFNIILKGRQIGATTITAGYIAWLMLFHREKNVLVVSTKQEVSMNVLKKVKSIFDNIPEWMMISKISVNNKTSLELDNGSKIKAASHSADVGRSESLSLLVVDEAAHVEDMEDLWTALYPTLSAGGSCVALSSPNGVGNWFHKTYVDAKAGQNEFKDHFLPWWVQPERDKTWFLNETKNMSKRQIAQEYNADFLSSGDTVITPDDLAKIEKEIREPVYKTGFDRNYWIWKSYVEGHKYLITSDVSRGDGKDYSTIHVLDLNELEVAAEYRGKPKADIFAPFLFNVGMEYGTALIAVENVGIGLTITDKLIEMKYPNVYWSTKGTNEFINQWDAMSEENKHVAGYTISTTTRPLMIAKMEESARNSKIKTYSSRLHDELKTFIWNQGGKPEAMRGYNDDLVMSFAGLCWVSTLITEVASIEAAYGKALMGIKTSSTPFKGGSKDFYAQESGAGHLTKKDYEKFSWVIKR